MSEGGTLLLYDTTKKIMSCPPMVYGRAADKLKQNTKSRKIEAS
jgi:hypothetical protein